MFLLTFSLFSQICYNSRTVITNSFYFRFKMLTESISETSPLLSMIDLFCLVDGLVSLIVCKSFSDHIHSWLMARLWLLWEILVLAWRLYWSNHTNKEIFQTFNSSNRHIFLSQVIFNHKKIWKVSSRQKRWNI